MRIIPLLLGLSAFACEVPEAPDAGRPVTDAGTRDAGLDAGNLCEAPSLHTHPAAARAGGE